MTNFQVYKKILSFSLLAFAVDLLALVVFGGLSVAGFFIGMGASTDGAGAIIGLIIGFILGVIGASLISIFIGNRVKAAQIAMMTKGVTEGQLPDQTFKAGFEEIKGRFGKITTFYFITRAIKNLFRQIGRGINRIGTAVGGDVGNSVTSVIDSAIQTLIGYLCDCCLGWIMYRSEQNSFKAGCEGAAIFFKNGKTLLRNAGRIFGMGFLSLLIIGGAFFGVGMLVFFVIAPDSLNPLAAEMVKLIEEAPTWIQDATIFKIVFSAFIGIIMWSVLHSVLIRPFILTGVLRNFMAAGIKDLPTEKDFAEMEAKYPKFGALYNKAQ